MRPISIDSSSKEREFLGLVRVKHEFHPNSHFASQVGREGQKYFWTGGNVRGRSINWPSGRSYNNVNWSNTGGWAFEICLWTIKTNNREGGYIMGQLLLERDQFFLSLAFAASCPRLSLHQHKSHLTAQEALLLPFLHKHLLYSLKQHWLNADFDAGYQGWNCWCWFCCCLSGLILQQQLMLMLILMLFIRADTADADFDALYQGWNCWYWFWCF